MGVMEPHVDAGSLGTQRMALGLAADVERLNALDDIWTGYLGAEPDPTVVERDLPELNALVDEMSELIGRVAHGSSQLRHVIRDIEVDLDDQLQDALRTHPGGEALLGLLPEGPFARQVSEACSIVEDEAGPEIDALRRKLTRLVEEGYSPGDIGGRLKCAILLVGAGASLVGLVLTPVAPVPGIVIGSIGILTSTLAAANGWNCKRAGDIATA
jgi:hypothetical protein